MIFTANTWDLVVELPLVGLRNNLDRLDALARDWNLTGFYTVHNHTALNNLIEETRQAFYLLAPFSPQLQSHRTDNGSIMASHSGKRKKRGLFDVGGDIMWALFGTGRQNDITDINNRLDQMANSDEALIHAFDKQTTFLRQVADHINAEDKRITDTVAAVHSLHAVTEQMQEQVESNTAALRKAAKLAVYSQIISALNYFRNRITELHFAIHRLELGFLDSSFLPPRKLYEILSHITAESSTKRFKFVMDITLESVRKVYQWKICTHVPANAAIRVLMRIPLMSGDDTFSLYRVHPFPTRHPGENRRVKLVTSVRTVAMTPTLSKFIALDERHMTDCIHANVLICPQTHVYMINPERHCLFGMLTGTPTRNEFRCGYDRKLPIDTEVLPLTPVRWAISTVNTERFQISCMDNLQNMDSKQLVAVRTIEIRGNAILNLPMHCQARSEDWELPLRLETSGTTSITLAEDDFHTPPMPENFEFMDNEVPSNTSLAVKALLGMTQTYLDLAKEPNGTLDPKLIDQALDDFHKSLRYRHFSTGLTFWRIFYRALSFVGLIVLIVIGIYLRAYCNSRRHRRAEVFEPIQMVRRPPRRRDTPSPAEVAV